ncbi:AmmeMemoRadiSam system protein B [bacterium]|nr:AmmeMemoRadiSam system protein B [bacterium]
MGMGLEVRKPVVAGQFYPADPDRLRNEITAYLDRVDLDRSNLDILALVAPHAGYIYSAPVAAFAYRQVRGRGFDTVAVISPSHRESFGYSSVFGGKSYLTPLGELPVDREAVEILEKMENGRVRVAAVGHLGGEHALEVQLPFLQVVLEGPFNILPVVMGSQDQDSCQCLAGALMNALAGRRALVVASTDLSHYHSQQRAECLDSLVVERINAFDPDGLFLDIRGSRAEACGAGPLIAAMIAARGLGADSGEDLSYATSGERSGDYNHVVGYTAGIFYRKASPEA